MQHTATTFGIGVLLIVLPLLGLPASWKSVVVAVLGLWLIIIAFWGRMRSGDARTPANVATNVSGNSFVENGQHSSAGAPLTREHTHDQSPQA